MKSKEQRPLNTIDFTGLVAAFRHTNAALTEQAAKAVNVTLTLRNWCFGCYLSEFEQRGADRAQYGGRLIEEVSARLGQEGVAGVAPRSLRQYRQFYLTYPGIWQTPSAKSLASLLPKPIWQTLNAPLERAFYEVEALRGHWSVRELKRQIATQYYQRSSLSTNKGALSALANARSDKASPQQIIRDPYVFEFLGLKPQEAVTEGQLEEALLDRLQAFLLELGHGFCFEARQQRLLIGGEHYFVDLVFYHRVLKCHVLIELKNDRFHHEHLGQLNSYVSYYKQHQMTVDDQPPIGILLCTHKNHELVQYALADMSNQLFVSRYQVQLPGKEAMEAFLHKAVEELGGGDE